MVRTYGFNPSTQTSSFMPGSSSYGILRERSVTPPQIPKNRPTKEEQPSFSNYYKSPKYDPMPTKKVENNASLFGIQSVVIDGQCFYRLLDEHLNKALNEQFSVLKPNPLKDIPHDPIQISPKFKAESPKNDEMIDDLPWARGNPQPKNGKRGSYGWNFGQRFNPFASDPVYKPNVSWNSPFMSSAPKNLYQTSSQEAYSYLDAPKPINYPTNLSSSFSSEPLPTYINQYGNTIEDQTRYEKEQHRLDLLRQIEDNNRRKMLEKQNEWEEEQRERWRSDMTLRRQRQEVQKEQDEIRERQMAAELKVERAKFDAPFDRKVGNNRENRQRDEIRKKESTPAPQLEWWEKKPSWQERQNFSPALPINSNKMEIPSRNEQSRASWQDRQTFSPALPIHNNKMEIPSRNELSRADSLVGYSASRLARRSESIDNQGNFERPISIQSRQSRSHSRSSRRSYQPSLVSAGGSNTSALQKLSATQNQLEREFEKLQSAVAKNKYDSKVFD